MSRYAAIGRDAEGLAVVGSVLDVSAVDTPLWTREAVEDAALTLAARALLAAAAARRGVAGLPRAHATSLNATRAGR